MKQFAIRHPALFAVLTVAVLLVLLVAGFWAFGFNHMVREPVALGFAAAGNSPEMRRFLGEPMRIGPFTGGDLDSSGGSGIGNLRIPINGPLAKGTLFEFAREQNGQWRVCTLMFRSSDWKTSIFIVTDQETHCGRR